jgi:hypothetical protein
VFWFPHSLTHTCTHTITHYLTPLHSSLLTPSSAHIHVHPHARKHSLTLSLSSLVSLIPTITALSHTHTHTHTHTLTHTRFHQSTLPMSTRSSAPAHRSGKRHLGNLERHDSVSMWLSPVLCLVICILFHLTLRIAIGYWPFSGLLPQGRKEHNMFFILCSSVFLCEISIRALSVELSRTLRILCVRLNVCMCVCVCLSVFLCVCVSSLCCYAYL